MRYRNKSLRPQILSWLLFVSSTLVSQFVWSMDADRLNQLKVAYVYNFTKFIEWKNTELNNFDVCLNIRNEDLAKEFSKLTAKGLRIRRIENDDTTTNDWRECHIIYLDSPLSLASDSIRTFPDALIISEVKDESAQIYFTLINNKLRFSIGRDRAEQAGLSISSKLLRLAHEVY